MQAQWRTCSAGMDEKDRAKDRSELVVALTSAGDAVLGAAVLTALGAWAGTWADEKLHTSPLMVVLLSLAGMILGLARMVKKALDADRGSSTGKGDGAAGLTGRKENGGRE